MLQTMRTIALIFAVSCGCHAGDDVFEQPSEADGSSTDALTTGTTTVPVTTTTTTGGSTAVDPAVDAPADTQPLTVELTANTSSMSRAGAVVLTAHMTGEATQAQLKVRHPDLADESIPWPVGQPSLEYVVNRQQQNGTIAFELVVQNSDATSSATVDVAVDLPPSGTLDLRLTSPASSSMRATSLALAASDLRSATELTFVGNQNDIELLFGHIDNGELWTKAIDEPMFNPVVTTDSAGNLFVAGQTLGGDMEVRKYDPSYRIYWHRYYPKARPRDIAVKSENVLYVAGEVDIDVHTEAAMWVTSESGGGIHWPPVTYVSYDESDVPLSAGLHAIGFYEDKVVAAGHARTDVIDQYPTRATLFELDEGKLVPRATHLADEDDPQASGWLGLNVSPYGVVATGWHRAQLDAPPTIALGRFTDDLQTVEFEPGWAGTGTAHNVARHPDGSVVLGGERLVDQTPHALVHIEGRPEYVDQEGSIHAVAVDQYGYIIAAGELTGAEAPQMLLLRFHP